jgi:hypothetical protein
MHLIASIAAISAIVGVAFNGEANSQNSLRRLVVKNGESIEVGSVYFVVQCKSVVIGAPEIEVMEGPSQVALSIREEPVLPRRQACAEKVPGGTLLLSAKGVTEPVEGKLTYRINFKTKDGPRQAGGSFIVSLFP